MKHIGLEIRFRIDIFAQSASQELMPEKKL